jgi:hypothetical protein
LLALRAREKTTANCGTSVALSAIMPIQEFNRGSGRWLSTPIHQLGLQIAGTPLEPILVDFQEELRRVGITRIQPHFYLSTEWGVPFGTISIAIPFYLAHPELTALHAERIGHIEGFNRADILRYLRHEMGHVINYGYQLYERPEWVQHFGSITQPYEEEYRTEPFSRRYVRHLPGWYAQKHPDEDWAETFAVWLTPGRDWRADYMDWPHALAKLEYCERLMAMLRECDPLITAKELDEDVTELTASLEQYYGDGNPKPIIFPRGLGGALRAIFEDLDATNGEPRPSASALIHELERELSANVYRWTGHFPERTRLLVRHLAEVADRLTLHYAQQREREAVIALTTLVTALAMNHVHRGSYLP